MISRSDDGVDRCVPAAKITALSTDRQASEQRLRQLQAGEGCVMYPTGRTCFVVTRRNQGGACGAGATAGGGAAAGGRAAWRARGAGRGAGGGGHGSRRAGGAPRRCVCVRACCVRAHRAVRLQAVHRSVYSENAYCAHMADAFGRRVSCKSKFHLLLFPFYAEKERREADLKFQMNELTKGVNYYKRLGLEFEKIHDDRIRLVFTQVNSGNNTLERLFGTAHSPILHAVSCDASVCVTQSVAGRCVCSRPQICLQCARQRGQQVRGGRLRAASRIRRPCGCAERQWQRARE